MLAISTAAFVSVLALASSLAVVVQAAGPRPECTERIDVAPGQTCDTIGAKLGLDRTAILQMNPQINCDHALPAGSRVCTKHSATRATCTVHAAATGTTCDGLASMFAMIPATFVALNDDVNGNCTNLVVGQLYCVSVAIGGDAR